MEKRFKESKEIMDAYLTYAVGGKGSFGTCGRCAKW